MKLEKHIATRFLADKSMPFEICDHMYPEIAALVKQKKLDEAEASERWSGYCALYDLLDPQKNDRVYYVTETVMDKLELLKVNKTSDYLLQKPSLEDDTPAGTIKSYDWSVFDIMSNKHITLILPDNQVLKLQKSDKFFAFIFVSCKIIDWNKDQAHINWTCSFIDFKTKRLSANWPDAEMQAIELYVYRLLCFFFLSEITEQYVKPGQKYGTRKSGKVINTLPVPIVVVNSNWNITSIRTEGFDVSGHFRLQPYKTGHKLIWIDPFKKHGYVRHAKKEDEL